MKRFVIGLAELIVLAGLSYGLFLLCAGLYTRHNTFSAYWHPDEPSKASQLRRDDRNFNHPQLLLEATIWLGERENTPNSTQAIVETGRRASAYMAAAGAVLLAWAGYFAAGRIGFALAALGAGLCPAVLCHAHYMKEDAALCFGVAAVVCAGAAMLWRWHWIVMLLLAGVLGAACGLAASGKYVGAVMIVPAVLLAVAVCWRRWWIMPLLPLIVLGSAVWTWQGINHRAIQEWDRFQEGFDREKAHSIEGHSNVKIPIPNTYFPRLAWTEAMPHVKVLTIATPLALLVVRRRRARRAAPAEVPQAVFAHVGASSYAAPVDDPAPPPPAFWRRRGVQPLVVRRPSAWFLLWIGLCFVAFAAILSQNTIPFYRYALPLTWMLYTAAAVGATWLAKAIDTRFTPAWLMGLCLAAVIGTLQWERCQDYLAQFAADSRYAVRHWSRTLPPGTRIAADGYTALESGGSGFMGRFGNRVEVERYFFAPQAGRVEDLVRRRVNYVAIASTSYERFLDPDTTWVEDPADFESRRRFYETLFAKYPVVKKWSAEHPMRAFTNPEIYVFKLNDPDDTPRRRRPPR